MRVWCVGRGGELGTWAGEAVVGKGRNGAAAGLRARGATQPRNEYAVLESKVVAVAQLFAAFGPVLVQFHARRCELRSAQILQLSTSMSSPSAIESTTIRTEVRQPQPKPTGRTQVRPDFGTKRVARIWGPKSAVNLGFCDRSPRSYSGRVNPTRRVRAFLPARRTRSRSCSSCAASSSRWQDVKGRPPSRRRRCRRSSRWRGARS